ncbi:hypothetical protein [Azotobacter vinelandii]|uniref:hypothetical protein n=1 Tax=Azotobacter vinelandii TaxID=354 RepID=UPI000AB83A60|nr:hypothetical protein [Azotobacter vinelandii]
MTKRSSDWGKSNSNPRSSTLWSQRLGFVLGRIVSLLVHSRNPIVRWIKRAIILAAVVLIFMSNFSGIAGALLDLGSLGLVLYLLLHIKSGRSMDDQIPPRGWGHGPAGYGFYDMYGNCRPFGREDD